MIFTRLSGAIEQKSRLQLNASVTITYFIGIVAAYWTIERIAGFLV